jgi:hypothetical protein
MTYEQLPDGFIQVKKKSIYENTKKNLYFDDFDDIDGNLDFTFYFAILPEDKFIFDNIQLKHSETSNNHNNVLREFTLTHPIYVLESNKYKKIK